MPNVLFLMADMMQAQVLRPGHPCQTPNLDYLISRGVRFERAYTPSPICGPARASLMTGLLPHSHGVTDNAHCCDEDQANLRTDKPHFAQKLRQNGYRTGYFGKWHVDRYCHLNNYGWTVDGNFSSDLWKKHELEVSGRSLCKPNICNSRPMDTPPGYPNRTIYGATDIPTEKRSMGISTDLAESFIKDSAKDSDIPWCCFLGFQEPHNPFIASKETLARYKLDDIELPESVNDKMLDKPGLYRKNADLLADWTEHERKQASLHYYATITEVDQQCGRVINLLRDLDQLDDTIIIVTSDHGQSNWAHGLLTINAGAFEELYKIPMIISGPKIPHGLLTDARVGLHDLCPTILELTDAGPIATNESQSFASVLRDPRGQSQHFTTGYAEFYGARFKISQRVFWQDNWKYVLNGFDYNEMYNLDEDPGEMHNLANGERFAEKAKDFSVRIWQIMKKTDDKALYNANFPTSRMLPVGREFFDDTA